MAVSSRQYRFPAPGEEAEPARRSAGGSPRPSCGACGASAVASCVALCCCPCAVVSCFTLALVKAPYVAGRRWVRLRLANAKTRRARRGAAALRNRKRVRSLEEEEDQQAAEGLAVARASKEWCELGRPAAASASGWWVSYCNTRHEAIMSVAGEGRLRVSATEEAWMEMYEVGNWGFGRLSFSVAGDEATQEQVIRGDTEKDGSVAAGP